MHRFEFGVGRLLAGGGGGQMWFSPLVRLPSGSRARSALAGKKIGLPGLAKMAEEGWIGRGLVGPRFAAWRTGHCLDPGSAEMEYSQKVGAGSPSRLWKMLEIVSRSVDMLNGVVKILKNKRTIPIVTSDLFCIR